MVNKEFLEVNKYEKWKPCMFCNGEIMQVRKALFRCIKCKQDYIADEVDMKLNFAKGRLDDA